MTTILSGLGGSNTVSGASGGKVYPFNDISTTPRQVLAANPQRQSVTFHNPHATISMFVAPTIDGNGNALVPTTSALGGCFKVFAGATLELTGEVQTAWQAFSESSSALPFTAMDSNI